MKKLPNYPSRFADKCDCDYCRPKLQAGDYLIAALTVAFIGLFFLFVR